MTEDAPERCGKAVWRLVLEGTACAAIIGIVCWNLLDSIRPSNRPMVVACLVGLGLVIYGKRQEKRGG